MHAPKVNFDSIHMQPWCEVQIDENTCLLQPTNLYFYQLSSWVYARKITHDYSISFYSSHLQICMWIQNDYLLYIYMCFLLLRIRVAWIAIFDICVTNWICLQIQQVPENCWTSGTTKALHTSTTTRWTMYITLLLVSPSLLHPYVARALPAAFANSAPPQRTQPQLAVAYGNSPSLRVVPISWQLSRAWCYLASKTSKYLLHLAMRMCHIMWFVLPCHHSSICHVMSGSACRVFFFLLFFLLLLLLLLLMLLMLLVLLLLLLLWLLLLLLVAVVVALLVLPCFAALLPVPSLGWGLPWDHTKSIIESWTIYHERTTSTVHCRMLNEANFELLTLLLWLFDCMTLQHSPTST